MGALAAPTATAQEGVLHAAAMRGFFLMVGAWHLDNDVARVLLGNPPPRTFFAWKSGKVGRVADDTLRRIGYLAGIWKALEVLYSNPAQADSWLSRPNAAFGGQAPIQRMAAGDITDLAAVRSYLDAARAPW